MSHVTSHSINCPSCRASMKVRLYQSVNVSINPALKERVLKRTINSVKCPKCGQEVELGTNLLYHDMKKELMVWLRLDKARDGELPIRYRTLRMVHSYGALIEKILIYDTDLDDCVFELLKFVIWPQASGRKPEEYRGDEIRFSGANGDALSFVLFTPEGTKSFSIPKSEAVKMGPMVTKARSNAPAGSWRVVDRDFILAAL